jgi:hypothetical protein
MYVDDKSENCMDLYTNTSGKVLMWSRLWNQSTLAMAKPQYIDIVSSWEEVITTANTLAKQFANPIKL